MLSDKEYLDCLSMQSKDDNAINYSDFVKYLNYIYEMYNQLLGKSEESFVPKISEFDIVYEISKQNLPKTEPSLSYSIMNEITGFCEECQSRECCPEEDCVLFRIEKIVEKDIYNK